MTEENDLKISTDSTSKELYDEKIDKECISLCNTLNSIPGIKTFESCCGHGEAPFRIWFTAEKIEDLLVPIISTNTTPGYSIIIEFTESPLKVIFLLEGPVGEYNHKNLLKNWSKIKKMIMK